MTTPTELKLEGCTPEPLMNYLKALGILRLISEDAEHGDPAVRGAWKHGVFVLYSRLKKTELAEFFLSHYRPTAILAPWNGGCGFYKKWDVTNGQFKNRDVVDSIEKIATSTCDRLANYRKQISATKKALGQMARPVDLDAEVIGLNKIERDKLLNSMLLFEVNGQVMNLGKAGKDDFLATVRSSVVGEETLLWLDAALVLLTGQEKNRTEAPVLGTGGNVGNSDFSAMFVQALSDILPLGQNVAPPPMSARMLRSALFSEPVDNLRVFSIGQFDPGKAGGANSTLGTDGAPLNNPWDYVLMLEGCLVLGGAISRRMGASRGSGVFPFAVRSSNVAYGSAGIDQTRGEFWLPLWRQRASMAEVGALMSEGRAESGSRRATTGVGFARAVAGLGVDRGIDSFIRYEFQERLGQQYLATPLGRFKVKHQSSATLLKESDVWIERFRKLSQKDTAPPRLTMVMKQIDRAVYDYCRFGTRARFTDVVATFGKAERELSLSAGRSSDSEANMVSPLAGLSANWVRAADDCTVELELALSLSGIHDPSQIIGAIRTNLEPVGLRNGKWDWNANIKDGSRRARCVVWNNALLPTNLIAILRRRLFDGGRAGSKGNPIGSTQFASISSISTFIARETDDQRIEDLLWALTAVKQHCHRNLLKCRILAVPIPRAYALLKLLFLPMPIRLGFDEAGHIKAVFVEHGHGGTVIRPEPAIIPLLVAGRLQEACGLAMRRLRTSGLTPLPHRRSGGTARDAEWEDHFEFDCERLAASLLFPINANTLTQLVRIVNRPSDRDAINA